MSDAALADPPLPAAAGLNRRLALWLMAAALFSKILGFVREILMAHLLGATLLADGFRGAITAVLLPLALLLNDAVTTILIPLCRDWRLAGDAPRRLGALTLAATAAAFALMGGIELLGRHWVDAIVGGFDAQGRRLTLDLVRVMALGMPGAVILNCLASGEIALGRSRLTNLRATLLNLSVLVGIALYAATGQAQALAWSFAAAFDGLALWGLASLWWQGELRFAGLTPALVGSVAAEFARRLRPLLAVPVAEQGNVWLERVLASRFITGTVASMDYARTLTESAVLLVSQPLGLVVMSSAPAQDLPARIEAIARPILCLALPASVFLALFSPDITRFVFERGAFDETAVHLTARALRGIACGLWASTLGFILLRLLNSAGRNGVTALILVFGFCGNALFNLASTHFAGPAQGSLMLGFGETLRWIIVLTGAVVALRCGPRLLRLLVLAAAPAAALLVAGWIVHTTVAGTVPRLLCGGAVCALAILAGAALLVPDLVRAAGHALRLRLQHRPC